MNHKVEVQHAGTEGSSDIILIPQPTECDGDPLVRQTRRKLVWDPPLTKDVEMAKMEEVLSIIPCRSIRLRVLIW